MTTRRNYSCDLCNTEIDDETGIGIYFLTEKITRKRVNDSEHHLCNVCLGALTTFAKDNAMGSF